MTKSRPRLLWTATFNTKKSEEAPTWGMQKEEVAKSDIELAEGLVLEDSCNVRVGVDAHHGCFGHKG